MDPVVMTLAVLLLVLVTSVIILPAAARAVLRAYYDEKVRHWLRLLTITRQTDDTSPEEKGNHKEE